MKLNKFKEISFIQKKELCMPNSVFVSGTGELLIADGGNDRICIVNQHGELSVGSFGTGKLRFKEPVGFFNYQSKYYICDWHNHRIVVTDNMLNYLSEIGIFGSLKNSLNWKYIIRFIKQLSSNGSYLKTHFPVVPLDRRFSFYSKVTNVLEGLCYYAGKSGFFLRALSHKSFFLKPNGICGIADHLFVTQKNNRCITKISIHNPMKFKNYFYADSDQKFKFGRLGQISSYEHLLYICDEENEILWITDENLCLVKQIPFEIENFKPFSIAFSDTYAFLCGEKRIVILDRKDFSIVYTSEILGELHGIAVQNDNIIVANRSLNKVEYYEFS